MTVTASNVKVFRGSVGPREGFLISTSPLLGNISRQELWPSLTSFLLSGLHLTTTFTHSMFLLLEEVMEVALGVLILATSLHNPHTSAPRSLKHGGLSFAMHLRVIVLHYDISTENPKVF